MWEIGDKIKQYEDSEAYWEVLDRKMGGMGVVYIVKDLRYSETKSLGLPLFYAVKTYRDDLFDDSVLRDQFEQEAYIWIKLGVSPHIVRAYHVSRIKEQAFLFSEAVLTLRWPNNMRGWISSDLLNTPISLIFAIQFCMGMEYISLKGLKGHFDIKPENVLITDEGLVKITDWGLARLAVSAVEEKTKLTSTSPYHFVGLTEHIEQAGTLPYMAPEIFVSPDRITPLIDIYAFGTMFYEMVTGRLPLSGYNIESWRNAHVTQIPAAAYTINHTLPRPLSDLIMACLEKDPEKRPQNFVVLKERLAALLKEKTDIDFPTEVEVEEVSGADARMVAYGLHFLGKDEEAVEMFLKGLPLEERDKVPVMMWDDNELGWSFTVPSQLWKIAQGDLEKEPQNAKNWELAADLYDITKQYDKAIEHLKQAMLLAPDRADELQKQIDELDKQRHKGEFDQLIHEGDRLAKAGKDHDAVIYFEKALQLDENSALAWYNLGACQMELQQLDDALASFGKTVTIDPKFASAWNSMGGIFSHRQQIREAWDCFEKACEADPHYAKSWFNKGGLLLSMKMFDEALACFNKALEINPDYANALQARQVCLEEMKKKRRSRGKNRKR